MKGPGTVARKENVSRDCPGAMVTALTVLVHAAPAKNSGVDAGVDVNGPATGNFSGAAPDRGGRETW